MRRDRVRRRLQCADKVGLLVANVSLRLSVRAAGSLFGILGRITLVAHHRQVVLTAFYRLLSK